MISETLRRCRVFESLNDREIEIVSRYFEAVNFKKNEYIFHEGDPPDWFYIVASGEVKVIKHTMGGKDIILEIITPGEIFGGVAVLDKKPFPATTKALEPVTVIRIRRGTLMKIMDDYPILKMQLVTYFSDKLRDAHEMLKNISTERVEKRVTALLIKLSEKTGIVEDEFIKINIPLTRQDIAEMVGTTVESCIRVTSKLQKLGMVKTANGRMLIQKNSLTRLLEQ